MGYRSDTMQYKEQVDSTKKKITELQQDMTQKDLALNEAKEYQKSIQRQLSQETGVDEMGNDTLSGRSGTKKEKQLLKELEKEKKKVIDKDNKIDSLLSQLESKT